MKLSDYIMAHVGEDIESLDVMREDGTRGTIINITWTTVPSDVRPDNTFVHILWGKNGIEGNDYDSVNNMSDVNIDI